MSHHSQLEFFHSVVSKHFALQTPNTPCDSHVAFPYISLDIHRVESTLKYIYIFVLKVIHFLTYTTHLKVYCC